MTTHKVVSQKEWLQARKELLIKEKEFTRARDLLSEQRRALPWVKIEKDYIFDSTQGKQNLNDLFGDKGDIFHTYSSYSRGLDILNGAYNYIDLTPKGRDEGDGIMHWLHRHDQYEDS